MLSKSKRYEYPICGEIMAVNKSSILPGENSLFLIKSKRYECPICGVIMAADVLWKNMEDGVQKPFCGECRKPAVLISKRDNL
jgi:ribosomal protein S27AE